MVLLIPPISRPHPRIDPTPWGRASTRIESPHPQILKRANKKSFPCASIALLLTPAAAATRASTAPPSRGGWRETTRHARDHRGRTRPLPATAGPNAGDHAVGNGWDHGPNCSIRRPDRLRPLLFVAGEVRIPHRRDFVSQALVPLESVVDNNVVA